MKTLLVALFAMFLFTTTTQAQFYTSFNSSIGHVYTKPVAGFLMDHEVMFNYGLSDAVDIDVLADFTIGISAEYSYTPIGGETSSTGLINANFFYTPSFITSEIPVIPYFGVSYSYVEVLEYSDNGTGLTWFGGIIFPINEASSFFLQVRAYDFSTDTDLGNTILQTGFSYILQ